MIDNSRIYGKSYGSGKAYICLKCGTYVGTHKRYSDKALGLLADASMRKGKQICHGLFDTHWKNRKQRTKAYTQLAKQMNIDVNMCHFGYFDINQLRTAYKILKQWKDVDDDVE